MREEQKKGFPWFRAGAAGALIVSAGVAVYMAFRALSSETIQMLVGGAVVLLIVIVVGGLFIAKDALGIHLYERRHKDDRMDRDLSLALMRQQVQALRGNGRSDMTFNLPELPAGQRQQYMPYDGQFVDLTEQRQEDDVIDLQ